MIKVPFYRVRYQTPDKKEFIELDIPAQIFEILVDEKTTTRFLLLALWRRVRKVEKLYIIYSIAVILWFINTVRS